MTRLFRITIQHTYGYFWGRFITELRFLRQPGNRVVRKIYFKNRKSLLKDHAVLSHFACNIANLPLLLQIVHISVERKVKQYQLAKLNVGKYIRMIGLQFRFVILCWLLNAKTTTKSRKFLQLKIQVSRKNLTFCQKYQPSGARGTRSLPAMPLRLENPKWLLGSGKVSTHKFWGKISFLIRALYCC